MFSEIAAGDWMKVNVLGESHDIILTTAAVGELFALKRRYGWQPPSLVGSSDAS